MGKEQLNILEAPKSTRNSRAIQTWEKNITNLSGKAGNIAGIVSALLTLGATGLASLTGNPAFMATILFSTPVVLAVARRCVELKAQKTAPEEVTNKRNLKPFESPTTA